MAIVKFNKGSYESCGEHFKAREFDCPCTHCTETLIDVDLVVLLNQMRSELGAPLTITSAYRCEAHQHELAERGYETARGLSQHQLGKAADVTSPRMSGAQLELAARKAGFMAVGVARTWVHVDTRGAPARRWFYARR